MFSDRAEDSCNIIPACVTAYRLMTVRTMSRLLDNFGDGGIMSAITKDTTKSDRLARHKIFYWLFCLTPKPPVEAHDMDDLVTALTARWRALGNSISNLKMDGVNINWQACACASKMAASRRSPPPPLPMRPPHRLPRSSPLKRRAPPRGRSPPLRRQSSCRRPPPVTPRRRSRRMSSTV